MKKKSKEGVLNALMAGGKSWTELRNELKISEPALLAAVKSLKETNFVKKDWDKDSGKTVYVLSEIFKKSKLRTINSEISLDSLLERLEINHILKEREYLGSDDLKEITDAIKEGKFFSRKLKRIQKELIDIHKKSNKLTSKEMVVLSKLFDFDIEDIRIKPPPFKYVIS